MTYEQLWQRLTQLYDQGEAKAITRLVLYSRYGLSLADILCDKVGQLSLAAQQDLENIFAQLEEAYPVQYVLGQSTFCGRSFVVDSSVLIPRPETEELCRWIADDGGRPHHLLDIGTGSGCIAVTLALEMAPDCHVTAWDISPMALEVARNNAHRLGATIDCHLCDVLTPPDDYDIWDVIVSNPPYICQQEAATMSPNVLGHEPHTALFVPDDNPLLFYQAIASYACRALRPGGLLYVELNPLYADRVEELFTLHGLCCVQLRCDQFGKVRFAKATKQLQQ